MTPRSPRDALHLAALRGASTHATLNRLRGKRRDAEVATYFGACWRGAWWATSHDPEFDLSQPGELIERRGWREVQTQLHILEGRA